MVLMEVPVQLPLELVKRIQLTWKRSEKKILWALKEIATGKGREEIATARESWSNS